MIIHRLLHIDIVQDVFFYLAKFSIPKLTPNLFEFLSDPIDCCFFTKQPMILQKHFYPQKLYKKGKLETWHFPQ